MPPHRTAPKKRPLAARALSEAGGPAAAAGTARLSPLRLPRRLSPRKAPAQARARQTVEAILEAAVELFSSKGYARTSTNHLAARAGVSVGSLYQYFPNKDAILTTLLARHLEAVHETVSAALPVLADLSPTTTFLPSYLHILPAFMRETWLSSAPFPVSAV